VIKIISQLISLVFSIYSKGNTEILAEIGVRQIRPVTVSYLYSFAFISAFKHRTFKLVMFLTST